MVIWIARRFLVVALAAGLLVGGGVPGAPARAAKPTAGAGAGSVQRSTKPERVKCRRSQVAITVNRRTVACRSRRAALPLPRQGDSRLLYARFALADNLAGLRDRRGRRPRSLKKLFRKANPHAWAAVQSGLRRGLGRLDKMAAAQPALARISDGPRLLAQRNPECSKPDVPTQSESFISRRGGEKLTTTMAVGREAVLELGLESGDFVIHLQLTDGSECHRFDAPTCPTAAGVVDATDSSLLRFALSIAKRGEVLVSKSVSFAGNTTMHAEVGQDAKLDFIDIDDSQTANIDLGDRRQSFGPVSLDYTGLHRIRVHLPGPTYDSSNSAVDIAFTERGVTFGKSQLGQDAADIARSLDHKFATLVDKEIANFKKLEDGWNEPNRCARLDLVPASNALQLRGGDHGSVTGTIAAAAGGTVPDAVTRVVAQGGGTFTPAEAHGATPVLAYAVTAPRGTLTLTAQATSPAGVARADWSQPILAAGNPAFRIIGYAMSVDMHNDRGTGFRGDSWNGIPDAPVVFAPCPPQQVFCIHSLPLSTQVTSTFGGTVNGPDPGCPHTYPTVSLQNPGTLQLDFDPRGTAPASVEDGPPLLAIGDVTSNTCHAYSTAVAGTQTRTIPRAQLLSGAPVVVAFSASGTVPTESPSAASPTIDYTWSKSVTIQRVNEDGSPYAG